MTTPDWYDQAACRGRSDLDFHSEWPDGQEAAKAVCATCPVQPDCLAYALEHEPLGIWGGVGAPTRARMRQRAGIRLNRPDPIDHQEQTA